MRAEKYRGSRIRSPSWRNELKENEVRQKARQCRAFSFWRADCFAGCSVQASHGGIFTWRGSALCINAGAMRLRRSRPILMPLIDRARFSNGNPTCGNAFSAIEGLPSTNAQKKVRLFSHLSA
jgi:hypothetical protein